MPKQSESLPASAVRREAIIRAAMAVMQESGYAAVTARKVAAKAGMSLGHITYHFTGMEEVMLEAHRLAASQLQAGGARLDTANGPARDRFAELIAAGFTEEILNPVHLRLRIDLWSAALTRPEVAQTERDMHGAYRARLESLLREMAHYSRAERVPAVCDVVMATLDGLWLDWMRRRDRKSVARGLELIQKLATLELS